MFKVTVVFLSFIVGVSNAKSKSSIESSAAANVKVSDDLLIKTRYSSSFDNQLAQVDDMVYPGFHANNKGLSAHEGALGMLVAVGAWGKFEISGGGEFCFVKRLAVDSFQLIANDIDPSKMDSLPFRDLFEFRPSGFADFSLPVAGLFKIQYIARLERRIIRRPGSLTHLRFVGETRFSMKKELLSIPIEASLFYKGYIQERSENLTQLGGGLSIEILKNLEVEAKYSALWQPVIKSSNIFPLYIGVSYTLDLSK